MSENPIPPAIEAFATTLGPDPDAVLGRMDRRAEREGFPTVGPAVGGWLAMLAHFVDAERAFEFGSGFGYSAYWLARAMGADAEVILTEVDAHELADARRYFADGNLRDRAVFEHGDAIEVVADYDGPFDVVLLDNEKDRYVDAFQTVRSKVRPGGVVVADNALSGATIDFRSVRSLVEGGSAPNATATTAGIATYLRTVREDAEFETTLLPLGDGLSVSRRRA